MPESYDDLDAVRKIVDALSPFEAEDQKRISKRPMYGLVPKISRAC